MTHQIIKTDKYLLITSDEEIKLQDWCILFDSAGNLFYDIPLQYTDSKNQHINKYLRKVIAHLPSNNSSILEGLPLLPPLPPLPMTFPTIECIGDNLWEELTGGQEVSVNRGDWSFGFGIGYNKAKEKYKFTEDDVIKIVEKSRETGLTAEYLMLSLSQPKLHPTHFKVEMEVIGVYDDSESLTEVEEPKIINGVLQGEWIFE